jgi:hypothetical protein
MPHLSEKFGEALVVPMEPRPVEKLVDMHSPHALRIT